MAAETDLHAIGKKLVDGSREESFSAARGVAVAMFPYILQASSRMSTRAISKWLEENYALRLSAATIAKALREPEKHWELFLDRVYPAGLKFESAVGVTMEEFLFDRALFNKLSKHGRKTRASKGTSKLKNLRESLEYGNARRTLEGQWFVMNDATISLCKQPLLAELGRRRIASLALKLKVASISRKLNL